MEKSKVITARGNILNMYDAIKMDELIKEYQMELEYRIKYAGEMKDKIMFKNMLRRHQELFGEYIKNG